MSHLSKHVENGFKKGKIYVFLNYIILGLQNMKDLEATLARRPSVAIASMEPNVMKTRRMFGELFWSTPSVHYITVHSHNIWGTHCICWSVLNILLQWCNKAGKVQYSTENYMNSTLCTVRGTRNHWHSITQKNTDIQMTKLLGGNWVENWVEIG